MTDPVTAAALAYISKDFLGKFLGPTAEYLGEGLKNLTQKRVENVARIFKKAEDKLGEKIKGPGEVSPRIIKEIFNEGSYVNDELSSEYFGGILASSRTNTNRDDRGLSFLKIIEGLSTYQIRTHYICYLILKILFTDSGFKVNLEDRPKMQTFLALEGYIRAMDFSQDEMNNVNQLLGHSFFGLHKEDLIGEFFFGGKEKIAERYPKALHDGVIFKPSALGVELFLWGHGLGNHRLDEFLVQDTKIEIQKGINLANSLFWLTSELK